MGIEKAMLANFNSIKVRLELTYDDDNLPLFSIFQFHKGAIRTLSLLTLKLANCYFNSIKVRLEHLRE